MRPLTFLIAIRPGLSLAASIEEKRSLNKWFENVPRILHFEGNPLCDKVEFYSIDDKTAPGPFGVIFTVRANGETFTLTGATQVISMSATSVSLRDEFQIRSDVPPLIEVTEAWLKKSPAGTLKSLTLKATLKQEGKRDFVRSISCD